MAPWFQWRQRRVKGRAPNEGSCDPALDSLRDIVRATHRDSRDCGKGFFSDPAIQSLAAFYQCHRQPTSFVSCLESFRASYPGAAIHVVNDGGYDYEAFSRSIGAHYEYVVKEPDMGDATIFRSLAATVRYFRRVWDFLETVSESHFILLEDDVRIVRPHRQPFRHQVNGVNPGVQLPVSMAQALRSVGYAGPMHYGGCGGCVLDAVFLRSIPFVHVEALLRALPMSQYASDQWYTFIALFFGGTVGPHGEFAETFYSDIVPRLVEDRVAFLHQYKYDYGVEPSPKHSALLGAYRTPDGSSCGVRADAQAP